MSNLFKTETYLEPILVLDHEINANQSVVYNAWVDVGIFQQWFCPTGFSIALAEINPKPKGVFRIHMKSPEGDIYPTRGEYILLEKPNRIVYKDSWDDDRENNQPTIAEIIFEPLGEKTLLKIYSSFATAEQKETTLNSGVVDGWKMFLNNLNNLLQKKIQA